MVEQTVQQLADIIKNEIRKDWDYVIAISGEERSGKTTLGIILGYLIDNKFDLVKNISYIPNEKEIKEQFYSINQYQVLLIDEAIRALYKLRFFDRLQQTITEMYATEGFQNKVTIMCIPRFSDLTGAFRKYRVKIHIHVISRGLAIVYRRDDDKDISDPWHTKENLKLKEKMLSRNVNERDFEDRVRHETKTINYIGHFLFPDLDPKVKAQYVRLKNESRKLLEESERKQGHVTDEKYRLATIRLLNILKEDDPDFSTRKYAEETGLSFKQIAILLKEVEE